MKKKILLLLVVILLLFAGCTKKTVDFEKNNKSMKDGEYWIEVSMEGGTGRAKIASPARVTVSEGEMKVQLVWSSSNYDYMMVDGNKYLPINQEGNSVFEIPLTNGKSDLFVTANTTAMSTPHEIDYTLHFGEVTISSESKKESKEKKETSLDIEPPKIEGLIFQGKIELERAGCFQIFQYEEGFRIINTDDGGHYLIVPENKKVPGNLPQGYQIIQQPLNHIYLAASASMSLFDSLKEIDRIEFSGIKEKDWYIDNAKKAMQEGKLLFSGKYSEPDYELLLSGKCDLAIESTMILHSPEVKEKLEALGIPVFIDRASYETDPLGRTEWIKVYGTLTGKEKEAQAHFDEQKKLIEDFENFPDTEKSVAFFSINENGMVVTKKPSDYIVKMIEQAGGTYIFKELEEESNMSSGITMSMEEFYAKAVSADYLIYNAAIEEPLTSVDDLIRKNELFAQFQAVKNGNVWCTGKYLYQATDKIGTMITDIHMMLTEEDAKEVSFMKRLQ